jgi:serine/threonine protein kinase
MKAFPDWFNEYGATHRGIGSDPARRRQGGTWRTSAEDHGAPASALTPGTRLGVYEVTEQIGEGGMGQVYRATDTKLKRQVAIKILPPSLAADHDRLARFQREAEVLASLYVRPFPGPGGKWRVSTQGGTGPRWSTATHALMFLNPQGKVMFASYAVVLPRRPASDLVADEH